MPVSWTFLNLMNKPKLEASGGGVMELLKRVKNVDRVFAAVTVATFAGVVAAFLFVR